MKSLCVIAMAAASLVVPAYGQRTAIGQTQSDLKRAGQLARPSGKERERIQNAQRHLSEFDRKMSRGRFDKDVLDVAIEDVNNVVRNNTLSPGDRDALNRDLQSLRDMRERRGIGY